LYGLRYFSAAFSDAEVDRVQEKLSLPPELVVFQIVQDSKCSACGGEIFAGNLLFMESGNPLCLKCAELDGLIYLFRGNAKLSRLAHHFSGLSAIVLRFSHTRRRYERHGLLLDAKAVERAEAELAAKLAKSERSGNPTASIPNGEAALHGTESVYQLKITLLGVERPVWRRVLVPGAIDVPKLHRVIQRAMGWTNSHLHKFEFKEKCLSPQERVKKFFEPRPAAKPKTLAGRAPNRGTKFHYIYDFGDYWEHEVLVEKIGPRDPDIALPACIAGERACPPEDCGGSWGYEDLLEVLKDPKHADYQERIDCLGGDFDSEQFDIQEVNARLKRFKC
jgi:hypothetical protein